MNDLKKTKINAADLGWFWATAAGYFGEWLKTCNGILTSVLGWHQLKA